MATVLYKRWQAECGRKRVYDTEAGALEAAAVVMARQGGDYLGAYPCWWPPPGHGHWHIGHQPEPLPPDMTPAERVARRLALIGCNDHPTPWQAAYLEDVRYLVHRLGVET